VVDEENLNQVTVNWKTYQVSDDMGGALPSIF
jgi:hypothetical protein